MNHDRFGALRAALHPAERDAAALAHALDLCALWLEDDPDDYARVAFGYARENLSRWPVEARTCPVWLTVEAARDAPGARDLRALCAPGSPPPDREPRLSAWYAWLLKRVPGTHLRPLLAAIAQDLLPNWNTLSLATGRFSGVPVGDSIQRLARGDASNLTHFVRALSDAIPPVGAAQGGEVCVPLLELLVRALTLDLDAFGRADALGEPEPAAMTLGAEHQIAHHALLAHERALVELGALGYAELPFFDAPSTLRGLERVHALAHDAAALPLGTFTDAHVRGPARPTTQQTLF